MPREQFKIKIGRPTFREWEDLRAIRIKMALSDPMAFARNVSEEKARTPKYWKRSIARNLTRDHFTWIFAHIKDEVIGIIGVSRSEVKKLKHVAHIGPLFVKDIYRREGIGKLLMLSAFKELKKNNCKKVRLEVVDMQKAAISLYRKLGFKTLARLKKEYRTNGRFNDGYLMEKFL